MKIVMMNGGLANQVFQYIFLRYGELTNREDEWFVDDSSFFSCKQHNGYELERVFGIKLKRLSDAVAPDVWREIVALRKNGYSMPQILRESGMQIDLLLSECALGSEHPYTGLSLQINCNEFNPLITMIDTYNVYYYGYWINKKWFDSIKPQLLQELVFPPLEGENNQKYYDAITSSESVGIHIRRGDYISIGWTLQDSYYLSSCKAMLEKYPNAEFFVFSDDLEWCRQHAEECGFNLAKHTTYITGNMAPDNYRDMQLMSYCKHLIMSQSAFCYLAALLNNNLHTYRNPTQREV